MTEDDLSREDVIRITQAVIDDQDLLRLILELKILEPVGKGKYDFSDEFMRSFGRVNNRIQSDFTTTAGEELNMIEGMTAVLIEYLDDKYGSALRGKSIQDPALVWFKKDIMSPETLTMISVRIFHERLKLDGHTVFELMSTRRTKDGHQDVALRQSENV